MPVLVVVFGAGASFDSDPARPVGPSEEHRPPLANALFDMDRRANREAAAAFPRAAPALMAARADVKAGGTIEATLARLQVEADGGDPRARSQLMALRFYLQRVLTEVPDAWDAQAVRQTSYVSMLDQLARWQRDTDQALCLITFNYDTLLERAVGIVFGHRITHMNEYQSREGLHVYKPHGSVDWALAHFWHGGRSTDEDTARRAICDRPDLQVWGGDLEVRPSDARVIGPWHGRNDDDPPVAWVPALAIPVEAKPAVVMPEAHQQALRQDLADAAAMISIGWRARELHFLRLLQDALPSKPIPVWAVSNDQASAIETIDNLWVTGRFDRQRPISGGFASFADPEPPPAPGRRSEDPVLGDVLRSAAPTAPRTPGPGLSDHVDGVSLTYSRSPYAVPE